MCLCFCARAPLGVTWLITLGGQNRKWALGIVIYEGDKLERGAIGFNQSTYSHFNFLFTPLELCSQEKLF